MTLWVATAAAQATALAPYVPPCEPEKERKEKKRKRSTVCEDCRHNGFVQSANESGTLLPVLVGLLAGDQTGQRETAIMTDRSINPLILLKLNNE